MIVVVLLVLIILITLVLMFGGRDQRDPGRTGHLPGRLPCILRLQAGLLLDRGDGDSAEQVIAPAEFGEIFRLLWRQILSAGELDAAELTFGQSLAPFPG